MNADVETIGKRPPAGWAVIACVHSGEKTAASHEAAIALLVEAGERGWSRSSFGRGPDRRLAIREPQMWSMGDEFGVVADLVVLEKCDRPHGPIPAAEQARMRKRPSLVQLRAQLQAALVKHERHELRQADRDQVLVALTDAVEQLLADRLDNSLGH